MSKATVKAPSNIAFIKYWGARDLERVIPTNASISMTLDFCASRSTVEHLDEDGEHEIRWRVGEGGLETPPPSFAERVEKHLDRLRAWAGCGGRFRFATENSFPAAAGIASSASGFAALTLGVLAALGRDLSDEQRSDLTRRGGSGSATRSVLGGYVQWPATIDWDDEGDDALPAHQLYPASHWDLRDVVALVATGPKGTSSLDGHLRAGTSPHFEKRLQILPKRLREVRDAIASHDIEKLGTVIEAEAIDLHYMAMTSTPAIFYWQPGTLDVLAEVRAMREDGLAAYSTMDAGANVHVICLPEHEPQVAERLQALDVVQDVLRDGVGDGPQVLDEHLF